MPYGFERLDRLVVEVLSQCWIKDSAVQVDVQEEQWLRPQKMKGGSTDAHKTHVLHRMNQESQLGLSSLGHVKDGGVDKYGNDHGDDDLSDDVGNFHWS